MNASTDDLETGVVRDSISNKKCTSCDQNEVDNGNDGASEQKVIRMFMHDIGDIDKGYTLEDNSTGSIDFYQYGASFVGILTSTIIGKCIIIPYQLSTYHAGCCINSS